MAHVMKHTKASLGNMAKHYERGTNKKGELVKFSNQNIDTEKSHLNYNLAPDRKISQGEFVKKRCSEVKCLNRKDVNVMCSWVITKPENIKLEEEKKFFEASYKFLSNRYGGEKNVVSSFVHMDEVTPHLHFSFVPITRDKKKDIDKVSACEVVNRLDLQTFHNDLEKHMEQSFGREIGILNDATKDGNKSITQLKKENISDEIEKLSLDLKNKQLEVDKINSDIQCLQNSKKQLQGKIKGLEDDYSGAVLREKDIDKIKPEKGAFGSLKNITLEDVDSLKKTAIAYTKNKINLENSIAEIKNLRNDLQVANSKIPTINEKISEHKEKQKLINIIQEKEDRIEYLENFTYSIPKELRDELIVKYKDSLEQKIENTKQNSYEMEM